MRHVHVTNSRIVVLNILHSFQNKTVYKLCIESERVFLFDITMKAVISVFIRKHTQAPILCGKSLYNSNQKLPLWM
jgi:hypothetical protein